MTLKEAILKSLEDIGEITFLLIEHGVFSKQPNDRLEDFVEGPAFGPTLAQRVHQRVMADEASA